MKQYYFALTVTGSLYRIDPEGVMTRVNLATKRATEPAKGIIAFCPEGTRRGIIVLHPEEQKRFLAKKADIFKVGTSPIVALFDKLGDAVEALRYPNRQAWDQRWLPGSVHILHVFEWASQTILIHPDVVKMLLKPKPKKKAKSKEKKTRRAK